MRLKDKIKNSVKILKNPIVILIAILIAILLGIFGSKGRINVSISERNIFDWINVIVTFCKPFGDMYLHLLKMTVFPILMAAIVSSIAGLVKSPHIGRFLSRMLICFIIMLFFISILGTLIGIIGQPGANLSDEAKATLGESIEKSEYKVDMEISLLKEQPQKKEKINFIDFFVNIVPNNVFRSLADEMALQLVFFSILFGIAIGMIKGNKSDFIITLFEGLFRAFQKIINWLMYLLPFGLIFLLAGQITSSQKFFEVLGAMIKFILLFYIAGVIILIINTIIIWKRSKENLFVVFKELLDPIIIALATRSSFATLPAAIKAMDQRLQFYESTTKLYIPLGITLGRYGNILYFALASLFVSQLYAVPLTIGSILIIIIGSIFAGTATAGATGIATLGLMSIVLGPLGLPLEAVLILFMIIDTIIDPMRTLLIVHSNMAVNALVAEKTFAGERRKDIRDLDSISSKNEYINNIKKKGKITIAIRKGDIPLFHYKDTNGQLKGIDIGIANTIAKNLNVALDINQDSESEEDIIKILDNDEADFAVTRLSANSIISDQVAFSKPYLSFHKAILLNREQTKNKNIKELIANYDGEVGVEEKSSFSLSAGKIFPKAHVMGFPNYKELAEAIANEEVLGGYGNEIDFRLTLKNNPTIYQKTSLAVLRNTEDNYVIAIAQKNKMFLYLFNNIIGNELNLSAEQFILKYGRI